MIWAREFWNRAWPPERAGGNKPEEIGREIGKQVGTVVGSMFAMYGGTIWGPIVGEIVATVQDNHGSSSDAAEYLNVVESLVLDALRYYADYREEIDAWIADPPTQGYELRHFDFDVDDDVDATDQQILDGLM